MAHWKALCVYFPSQVECLDLELIWPLKSQFSQGHFLQLKKWAESQNFDVFWAFGGPNLKIKLTPSIGNSSFCMPFPKMSTFCDSEQSSRVVARGVRPLQWPKPVKLYKKFTNDKIFSKFLEIWAGSPQSSTMLIQRGFGQNLEWIGHFPSFLCFGQPSLEHLHSRRYFWHFFKTMTLVKKVKEGFLTWHGLDKNLSQFPKIHLLWIWNIFWVKLVPMCVTRDFAEMKRNEGDRGLINSWGNFWEWGGMLGSRGKWNLRDWVRGRGPKGQNTGPT